MISITQGVDIQIHKSMTNDKVMAKPKKNLYTLQSDEPNGVTVDRSPNVLKDTLHIINNSYKVSSTRNPGIFADMS